MKNSLSFFINNQKYHMKTNKLISIESILMYLNYDKLLIILEYNGQICQKKQWTDLFIKNNDIIQIITVVGGG